MFELFFNKWVLILAIAIIGLISHISGKKDLFEEDIYERDYNTLPDKDMIILWEETLKFEQNKGVFLCYIFSPFCLVICFLLIFVDNVQASKLFNLTFIEGSILYFSVMFSYAMTHNICVVDDKGVGGRYHMVGLNMKLFRRNIYYLYRRMKFSSRKKKYVSQSFKQDAKMLSNMKIIWMFIPICATIWYFSWFIILIYLIL